ncbi:MAG: SapC family protein [Gammaproteobacteria bacterium]
MNIANPPGYNSLVALDKEEHNGLGIPAVKSHAFAKSLNGIQVLAAELFRAARDYPLVFVQPDDSDSCIVIAVTSLEDNDNLFVDRNGEWSSGTYIPAFVRRWPFYGVPLAGAPGPDGEVLICVDESALTPEGEPLFDTAGNATAMLNAAQQLISQFESERVATEQLCRNVMRLGLLEPFEALALPKAGKEMRLGGMFRVDERKLNALPPDEIQQLMMRGELSRIYAHLMSLDNFQVLLDRAAERASQPDSSK